MAVSKKLYFRILTCSLVSHTSVNGDSGEKQHITNGDLGEKQHITNGDSGEKQRITNGDSGRKTDNANRDSLYSHIYGTFSLG